MDFLGGVHSVRKMLETYPSSVNMLFISGQSSQVQSLVDLAKKKGVSVTRCDKDELNHRLPNVNHQGVMVRYIRPPSMDLHTLIKSSQAKRGLAQVLVLDKVQDPQNLGACLRSSAAFGVDGIIIPKDKAVGLTPAVIKVSVGAAATVPVVAVTNIARSLRLLKEAGFWIYGTSERAEHLISQADVSVPIAWVMGNEMKGISPNVEKHCDALYRINTTGFSTLNIATSASICLYQTYSERIKRSEH